MNRKAMLAILVVIVLSGAYLALLMNQEQSNNEEMYAYGSTIDGGIVAIPYSRPNKTEYVAEQAAHIREVPTTSSTTIGVGSQAVIPENEWVEVVNERPIKQRFSNRTNELAAGGRCFVDFGGLVTVAKVHGDNLLAEYTAPGNPVGTSCPSGTQFIVSKSDFAVMSVQYATTRDSILAEKELVKRILAQNHYSEPVQGGKWRWVDVVNLEPVVQHFTNGHGYLDHGKNCLVGDEEGITRIRGKSADKVLYEYTARGNPMGTACPSGVLFFEKQH